MSTHSGQTETETFWPKTRKCILVLLWLLVLVCGGNMVEHQVCVQDENSPGRSRRKHTPLQLICTLLHCLKRDIWKTADRCDKGGYDSSSFSSFASIPPPLSYCLLVLSPCPFQHLSSSVYLFFPPFLRPLCHLSWWWLSPTPLFTQPNVT